MKLKVNNNFIKESSSMEERNETVGLKVKDVRTTKDDDPIPVFPDPVDEPKSENTISDTVKDEENSIPEQTAENDFTEFILPEDIILKDVKIDSKPKVVEIEKDGFEKIACARLFNANRTTVFRFDIFYKKYAENSGTIEYRNIIDNFNSVRPTKVNELKEFFAMFGIIRWNFPKTVLPVNTNVLEALLKIESLINEQIVSVGIKKGRYEFRVETVDED